MSPGVAMGSPVDSLCDELSSKITLSDSCDTRKRRSKSKHYLVRLLRGNVPLNQLGFPAPIWDMLQKHLSSDVLARCEQEEEEEKYDDDLVERSPMRSPRRSPDYQVSYAPYKSFHYKGSQRVQETSDGGVTAFLHELQQNPDMMRQFTEFCEALPGDHLAESDESCDSGYITNESYKNNMHNEWESARCEIQHGGPRTTRYSFSSTASTSSSSPYPSPGPALSSSPPSPAPSNFSYDNGVHEITEGWLRTTMEPHLSPTGSHGSMSDLTIPATVTDLAWDYPGSASAGYTAPTSPPAAIIHRNEESERSYHELKPLGKDAKRSSVSPAPVESPMKKKLYNLLNPAEKENAWSRIQQLPLDKLASGDSEGDTQLMILLANQQPQQDLYVYNIVERLLKESPSSLAVTNRQGKDALRIAVEDCVHKPLIVAYIAEAYLRAAIPFKEYNENQETLLHITAKLGDDFAEALQHLLLLRRGATPVFDVNQQDSSGHTPMHMALKVHGTVNCYVITKLLLQHGANLLTQDYLNRNTPLHMLIKHSSDLTLIRAIRAHLKATDELPLAADTVNRQNNTILHLACAKNSLPLAQHKMLVETLVSFGGRVHLKNVNGHVPSYLVEPARKEDLRAILHGKSLSANEFESIYTDQSLFLEHNHPGFLTSA